MLLQITGLLTVANLGLLAVWAWRWRRRRRREDLAMVAQRTFNGVCFCNTAWQITWVNEGFTRMTGYSAAEAVGRRPSELLHSPLADPLTAQNIDRLAEAGQRVEIQVLQRNKSGQDYWVDLEVIPVLDRRGRISHYMSVQANVTEEVRAKAARLLEKERADNILSATNVGTWESNLRTGEHRWNDRWNAMLGFAREDVQPGLDAFWQQRVHPADRSRLNRAMADCLVGRSEGLSYDVRVRHRDGSWRWVLCRARVLSRDPYGRAEWVGGINTDITDIKQAEFSLRDMEDALDRAGRMAGLGAWQIELKTRAVRFSPQTCALHGLDTDFQPTEEAALGFYPEPDRARLRQAMLQAEREGSSWDMVLEFRNAQGRQLWVRSVGEVGFDDSGPVRLVGALQDVTRDQLAQREVQRSSALLRGAIEAIDEAFVLFDPQDRLVYCNDKFRAIFPRSADLMQPGQTFEAIIRGGAERGEYSDAVGRVDAWVQQRLELHRSGHVATEQRLDDGRYLKVIERRMPDGHMVGFRVDITELKHATARAEQISARIQDEQKRMQSILEGTHVGTWEWNVQTGESRYNDQYAEMLGYTPQDFAQLGSHAWRTLVHPEDLPASERRMQQHLRDERSSYEIEVRMQHKAGHWIWVLAKGKLAQRLEDGRPLWVYGTHMDISKQKKYESSLREAMLLAEQSSVAKSQFLANMSHEIRTPMNAILGMLQLLRGTALNGQQNDYTDKAMGAARSLLGLLNDILDFSKVEAGKMQLNPEPFVLEELLGDLSVILSSNLGQRAVDLLFEVDPAIPRTLVGDAMRLRQILINLGGNAVKFTETGEVVIRWTLESRQGRQVRLAVAVQDSGIGIAPENQARIFEGFTQAEANTTRRFGGTGLGLAISTRLIRLMGGELTLQSQLQQGSTFRFTLELQTPELLAPAAAPDAARTGVPLVLLVDDHARALRSHASMLGGMGWHVHQADHGAAGLAWLQARQAQGEAPPDAVFVDAEMPGMDGWETARRLRRLYGRKRRPALVLLSRQGRDALGMRSQREQALVDGLLVKPLTATMFAQALAQAQGVANTGADPAPPSAQRLHGMRILVVEDNAINQQVAQELLQAEGAQVVLADNGALGLQAIASAQPPFHVVLMDLQMPVLDGLSATRTLRSGGLHPDLPVIAMTANAMQSDREECLAAGMNDHIGKPFDLGQLVQTLQRHTGWQGGAEAALLPLHAFGQAQWPADIAVEQALARVGGKRDLLARAMLSFEEQARTLPTGLVQLHADGQLQALQRELHSLKGLAATLGLGALSALAAQAEKQVLQHQPAEAMEALLARIAEQLEQTWPRLEQIAWQLHPLERRSRAEPAQPRLPAVVAAQLQDLLGALRDCDMGALELHAKLQQGLEVNIVQAMAPLDQAMAALDFAQAAQACEELQQRFSTTTNARVP